MDDRQIQAPSATYGGHGDVNRLDRSGSASSAVDMNLVSSLDITGIKNEAIRHGSEIAKLQIQYNLILKENEKLREKQE